MKFALVTPNGELVFDTARLPEPVVGQPYTLPDGKLTVNIINNTATAKTPNVDAAFTASAPE